MTMRAWLIGGTFAVGLLLRGLASAGDEPDDPPHITIQETKVGDGVQPKKGQTCTLHWTAWLYDVPLSKKGDRLDSTHDRKATQDTLLEEGAGIRGFIQGISTMKVGGKRTIVIPPELAWGDKGLPTLIPAGATLWFEVELIAVK